MTDHIQPYFVDGKPTFEFTFAVPLELPGFRCIPSPATQFLYTGRFDMMGEYIKLPVILTTKRADRGTIAAGPKSGTFESQFIGYTWACKATRHRSRNTVK